MSHVIIVSNRLPVSVTKRDGNLVFSESLGGLATSLSSYVKDGKSLWVGWPGVAREELTETERQTVTEELAKHQCVPVFLTKKQIENFYNGYSNRLLWPVCHDLPLEDLSELESWWRSYRDVNRLFAETTLSLTHADSSIWVHDYQLMLVPELLRTEHAHGHIGFFLHIPFPPVASWTKVPQSKQLIKGLLGADMVGFHTPTYCQDFLANCKALGFDHDDVRVAIGDRQVQVSDFPIGVDYNKYANAGRLRGVRSAMREFRKAYGKRKVIVAIDRLEPSKGLVQRLQAYRHLLETHPDLHNKVVMVMVAAPSRMEVPAYQRLKRNLETEAAAINELFGTTRWQPVDLKIEPQPFERVTALYRIADVAFIAPLRDGMNLVAKEFVASKKKSGVLVLSETAGAAEELGDALLVNPSRPRKVAQALEEALTMPKKELQRRLTLMQKTTSTNTIHTWANGFMKALQAPVPGTRPITRTLQKRHLRTMQQAYRSAGKRLFLLDYDGSLVPLRENFTEAKPSQKVLTLLEKLLADERNEVVVVSGRSAEDLDAWLGHLPLHFVAEHGAVTKRAGGTWQRQTKGEMKWRRYVTTILKRYTALTPGAHIEDKPHSLVWHYRGATPYYAQKYSVIIRKALRPVLKYYGITVTHGNKILEIKDPRINKGEAIQRWLKKRFDFVFIIGDDLTDEDMFRVAPPTAYTLKIGRRRTFARYRVLHSSEALYVIQQLLKPAAGTADKHASPARQPAFSR